MDVNKVMSELRAERARIDEVLAALERLASGQGKRRGRPPKWLKDAESKTAAQGSKSE